MRFSLISGKLNFPLECLTALQPTSLPRLQENNSKKPPKWLLLYPDLIDSVQKNFWSKAIGFSIEQFGKSVFIKGRRPTRRLSYGVCNVEVNSRELKEKVMKWLELSQDYLLERYSKIA